MSNLKTTNNRFSRSHIAVLRLRRVFKTAFWMGFVFWVSVTKRAFDVALSLVLLIAVSPVLFLAFALCPQRPRIVFTLCQGRWATRFGKLRLNYSSNSFITRMGISNLPVLYNILAGHMSFVGPRSLVLAETNLQQFIQRNRLEVRPGLICLWWIRQRANIAYGTEMTTDADYIYTQTFLGDLGIAARAVPAAFFAPPREHYDLQISILGVPIDNYTLEQTLAWIHKRLEQSEPSQVCFVNADCVNIAYVNQPYFQVLGQAHLVLADGIGLKMGGNLLSRPIRENVNGTDMFPALCHMLSNTQKGLFLLGGRPGVAEDVCNWIAENHPLVRVCGYHHGFFSETDESTILDQIKNSGASLLLVALGAPRQDLWINRHLSQMNIPVAIGVGGLFDFYAGRIPRAPQWMRELCLEWTYRLLQEPGRMWKRYLIGNGLFLFRVIKEKCGWLPQKFRRSL